MDSLACLLATVDKINIDRRKRVVEIARTAAGGSLAGTRAAALGIAFKPNSDDIRDSPSLDVCTMLAVEGATVTVHDPVAMPNAARKYPGLRYAASVPEAARDAELLLHLTEWPEYRVIDPVALAQVVTRPILIDARCGLDATKWRDAGWVVRILGRPESPRDWHAPYPRAATWCREDGLLDARR